MSEVLLPKNAVIGLAPLPTVGAVGVSPCVWIGLKPVWMVLQIVWVTSQIIWVTLVIVWIDLDVIEPDWYIRLVLVVSYIPLGAHV